MKAFLLHILFALVLVTPAGAFVEPKVCPEGQTPAPICQEQFDFDSGVAIDALFSCNRCITLGTCPEKPTNICVDQYYSSRDEAYGHLRTCVFAAGCWLEAP